jgi:hypothetical protein
LKDTILVGAVVLAFAFLLTAHLAIAVGLVAKKPRWRAPVALVVAPLAPFWAWREHMRVRAGVWAAGLVLYVIARVAASF